MNTRINNATWNEKRNHWRISVQKNGIRKDFYSSKPGLRGKKECNLKADEWLKSDLVDQNTTVKKLYELYIAEKELLVGTSRIKNIKSMFNAYILKMIGNMKVSRLNEQNLQNILNAQFKAGNSYHRISETKIVLQDFIKYARKNSITKLFPENLYISKKAPVGERKALTEKDLKILFSKSKTKRFGKIVEDEFINYYRFLLLTGLRRGELLGLKWQDVKLPIIEIKRSRNEYDELTKGKTNNANRFVPLNKKAIQILNGMNQESEFIFPINRPQTLSDRFKAYAEYNNLTCTKLHELRHTFISYTDNALPINTLKAIVGHSKKMNTVNVYGHVLKKDIENAKEVMDNIFSEF